jgi:hypothetical protein
VFSFLTKNSCKKEKAEMRFRISAFFANKGLRSNRGSKSFGQAFSKACAVEAAEASSPSAEGESPYVRRFSFC